jgi:hypothetical protein
MTHIDQAAIFNNQKEILPPPGLIRAEQMSQISFGHGRSRSPKLLNKLSEQKSEPSDKRLEKTDAQGS